MCKMPNTNAEPVRSSFWEEYNVTTIGYYLKGHEVAFVNRLLTVKPHLHRLLDVGTGSGRTILPWHTNAESAIGIDIDPIELSALRQTSNIALLTLGDALRLPFADASMDCVIAIQCLMFFDYYDFLEECSRVLKDGGLLIGQFLNRHSYKWVAKKLFGRDNHSRIGYVSYHEFVRATVSFGFDVQAVHGYNWLPFNRLSDSALVKLLSFVERGLLLNHLYHISPWVLIGATKKG
jgi:SAM-dependent methyltransferase